MVMLPSSAASLRHTIIHQLPNKAVLKWQRNSNQEGNLWRSIFSNTLIVAISATALFDLAKK